MSQIRTTQDPHTCVSRDAFLKIVLKLDRNIVLCGRTCLTDACEKIPFKVFIVRQVIVMGPSSIGFNVVRPNSKKKEAVVIETVEDPSRFQSRILVRFGYEFKGALEQSDDGLEWIRHPLSLCL